MSVRTYLARDAGEHRAEGHGDAHVPIRRFRLSHDPGKRVEDGRVGESVTPPDYVRNQPGKDQSHKTSVLGEPVAVTDMRVCRYLAV